MSISLEVENLSYAYGARKALDQVSLQVRSGECGILLGPNGAGKSTLFSLITRLYDAPSGTVRIAGHDLRRAPRRALAALGVVFQQSTLDLDLTVYQNLTYHAALHGLDGRTADRRIAEELERLKMEERRHEPIRALNGGHRRRVEIARALIHRPAVLLMDEPTVGLDVPSREALVNHVHALCADPGVAVLWATHLIDEVAPTDRLVVLHRGQIRAEGSVDDILRQSGTSRLTEAFSVLTRDLKAA